MTGTLPTGMTLLRLADPGLRGLAARNIVVGVGLSVVPAAPLIVKVIQLPVEGWPETFPTAVWQTMGILVLYMIVLGAIWRWFGPLRSVGRATQLWPSKTHPLSET